MENKTVVRICDIVGYREVADYLGMKPQVLDYHVKKEGDFPKPIKKIGSSRIYDLSDIDKWVEKHSDKVKIYGNRYITGGSKDSIEIDKVAGVGEMAECIGVTKQAMKYRIKSADFPKPLKKLKCSRLYNIDEVKEWARTNKRGSKVNFKEPDINMKYDNRTLNVADICSVCEIAERTGVSKQVVFQWAYRYYNFPKPVASLVSTTIYDINEVIGWVERHGKSKTIKKDDSYKVNGPKVKLCEIIGISEIAKYTDVSKQVVRGWINNYDNFPKPIKTLGCRRIFNMSEVKNWVEANRITTNRHTKKRKVSQ